MTDQYKQELIGRAVASRLERLIGSVHDQVEYAQRLEILREIKFQAEIAIRRTNAARWAKTPLGKARS